MPHAPGGTTSAGPIGCDKLRGGRGGHATSTAKPRSRTDLRRLSVEEEEEEEEEEEDVVEAEETKEKVVVPPVAVATTSCVGSDRDKRSALHFACHCGHTDVVTNLILAGCDVNIPDFAGHTALQRAAAEGHVDIVQQLLKHGAQVDHQDDIHGNTALHEAAWKGFSQTVDSLCKAKANAYIRNKGGFVPLHLVSQNGHNQSCRVLLWSGCRPDIKNNYGDTPLHTAARYGHAGVMRILISARCSVNEKNKNGDTAVHISSAMGRRKLTRILLESSCDQNIHNKQGETAMDIARRKRFAEVGNILTNPPHLRTADRTPAESTRKQHKKREKVESGTSKDSKDSDSKHKPGKTKKSKRGHKGHHHHHNHHGHKDAVRSDAKTRHASPYGCQHYSTAGVTMPIQNLKLDSLPDEPLVKGEQYFLDLAGNIKKGPVGVGYACYCAPFFRNVEKKMENDKQELIEHIDLAHDNLNAKITHLERKTRTQLTTINEGMKERMAADKAECLERVDRAIATRITNRPIETIASYDRTYKVTPPLPPSQLRRDDVSSTSEEEDDNDNDDDDDDECNVYSSSSRVRDSTNVTSHLAAEVALAVKASKEVQFVRSRSEELLSEPPVVRSRSTGPPHRLEASNDCTTAAVAATVNYNRDVNRQHRMLSPHSTYRIGPQVNNHDNFGSKSHAPSLADLPRHHHPHAGFSDVSRINDVVAFKPPAVINKDIELDRDSGYTTKLHSSFESSTSTGAGVQVPNLPPRTFSAHRCPPVGSTTSDYRGLTAEFSDMDGRFFNTVINNETEKWYERRLQSMERKAAAVEKINCCNDLGRNGIGTCPYNPPTSTAVAAYSVPKVRGVDHWRSEAFKSIAPPKIRPATHVHSGNNSSLV